MKKDYAPVSKEYAEREETRYIADSWGERWESFRELPSVKAVGRREEFLLMRPYLGRMPKGGHVLDGGCGLGEWTVFVSELGYDVTGIDISERTIRRLEEALPGRRFLCGDIRDTGFANASFDAYFTWGTFEHFELGMEACVREAHRILKPGGLLFASVPFQNWRHLLRDQGPLHSWDETYDRKAGYTSPQRFYQWRFTRAEFQRELELRGFHVLELRPIGKRHGVNRWLQHEAAWVGRIPLLAAATRRILTPLLPAGYIAHMLWAVARRTDDDA